MRQIVLIQGEDAWYANFVNNNTIKEHFGTTVLPTAFRATATAATVIDAIQKLNPDAIVTLL